MTTGYIYKLTDPRDGTVWYVGQTICSLKKRVAEHYYTPINARMAEWIAELRSLRLKPVISLLEEVDTHSLDEREIFWIQEMIGRGEPITNRRPSTPPKLLTVRLPYDLHAEVKAVAQEDGRSVNDTIVRLIKSVLDRYL